MVGCVTGAGYTLAVGTGVCIGACRGAVTAGVSTTGVFCVGTTRPRFAGVGYPSIPGVSSTLTTGVSVSGMITGLGVTTWVGAWLLQADSENPKIISTHKARTYTDNRIHTLPILPTAAKIITLKSGLSSQPFISVNWYGRRIT
jgi:hypothetical protein